MTTKHFTYQTQHQLIQAYMLIDSEKTNSFIVDTLKKVIICLNTESVDPQMLSKLEELCQIHS